MASRARRAFTRRRFLGAAASAGTIAAIAHRGVAPAFAQAKPTVLKWAHVYETSEPYHTEALWAAEEIKKRTNGKFEIQVFPASQLGNEPQINEALGLGTVDIIYTGAAFVGGVHKPLSISNCPYIFRNFDHWKAYRGSPLFRELAGDYEKKTGNRIVALTYYGERHLTCNKEVNGPDDLKGMKLRVPVSPLFTSMFKALGTAPTAINFVEVYSALQTKLVDGQENPLALIDTAKFYEVQKYCSLTSHMWEGFWMVANRRSWERLPDDLRGTAQRLLNEGAVKQRADMVKLNATLEDELKKKGLTFNNVDKKPFQDALRTAGFYAEWKQKFGDESWAILEKYAGGLA
jgi:tripartite ATP-independent transporter DctP family solute receptor